MAARRLVPQDLVVGVTVFAIALALRHLLQPLLSTQFGFMFFIPAIGVAAWKEGRRAGLLVTLLSSAAVWYWWLPEFRSFRLPDFATALHLIAFTAIGVGIAYFMGEGRNAMHAARAAQAREVALRQDYEVTLRSIGDAVIATDAAGRVTFMNAVAEKLTGYAFGAVRGIEVETVFAISDEETRSPRPSPVREVLADRKKIGLHNHTLLRTRDGREVPIVDSAAPIFGEDGELRGVVLVFHDVVEQANSRHQLREANAALKQQIADLRQLQALSWRVHGAAELQPLMEEVLTAALEVNGTDKGLLSLATTGRDGLKVAASHGFSAEFLRELEFVPSGQGACGACQLARDRVVIEDVTTDSSFERYRAAAELGGFRSVHSTPLITREGKLIGVLSVHFPQPHRPTERETRLMDLYARNTADLIENAQLRDELQRELAVRREAEEALRVSNERFQLAAQVETLTLFEQDRDLRYTWLYPPHARLKNAAGRTDEELLGRDEAAPIVALKREVLANGIGRSAEIEARFAGRERCYELAVSPKRDARGEIIGVAGAAFDITQRKQAETELIRAKEALAEANQELEKRVRERTASLTDLLAQMEAFSYSISHDLRSPLRAITGFADVLNQEHAAQLDNDGRHLLQRIIRAGARMDRLITDVLAYTRINQGRLELKEVSLEECVRQVVHHAAELQPARADIVISSPLLNVIGNEAFLTQVFANLLGNAVKFVPAGRRPRVVIRTEEHGEMVRVWIEDNGIGIKPEYQSRIFGLFERLNLDRHYEGTGMGLAIVQRAVARMGGRVGVESPEMEGSRFWIDLPGRERNQPVSAISSSERVEHPQR